MRRDGDGDGDGDGRESQPISSIALSLTRCQREKLSSPTIPVPKKSSRDGARDRHPIKGGDEDKEV
jgi:hypothetical protein